MLNTRDQGSFTNIIFKEDDGDYCAVCLEFNLIEWGKNKEQLRKSIYEAAEGYLEAVRKNNLPEELLNNPA